jgi:hypothetical protein
MAIKKAVGATINVGNDGMWSFSVEKVIVGEETSLFRSHKPSIGHQKHLGEIIGGILLAGLQN